MLFRLTLLVVALSNIVLGSIIPQTPPPDLFHVQKFGQHVIGFDEKTCDNEQYRSEIDLALKELREHAKESANKSMPTSAVGHPLVRKIHHCIHHNSNSDHTMQRQRKRVTIMVFCDDGETSHRLKFGGHIRPVYWKKEEEER